MTEPPSDRPARTEDEQTRRIAATGVGIGCTTFILGGALFAVAEIIARGRPEPYTTTLGTIGAIAVGVGLAVTIGTGAFMNRRSRRAMRGLAIGRPIDPDIETIRRIESARLPATAEWSKFPTGLQVTREIDNGGTPIRFAANVPSLRPREKNKPMEIASSRSPRSSPNSPPSHHPTSFDSGVGRTAIARAPTKDATCRPRP